MAYIGRQPAYGSFEKQSLTADGSTTTFTLEYTVGSTASLMVSVAGVLQEPITAYSLGNGGGSIIFSEAPTTSKLLPKPASFASPYTKSIDSVPEINT